MYDHQSRLTGFYEHDGPNTSTQEEILQNRTVYGYNIDGTLHHIDYGFSQGNVKGLQFTYDQDKRLVQIDAKKAVGTETLRQYNYDEYGNIITQNGNDIGNEICYIGQIYDESTALYYYNARFYDPEDGIFTTQDTDRGQAAEPSTLNYYAYCACDPINNIDPSGHSFFGNLWKKFKKTVKSAAKHVVKTAKKVVRRATTRAQTVSTYGRGRSRYTRKAVHHKPKHRNTYQKKILRKAKKKLKKLKKNVLINKKKTPLRRIRTLLGTLSGHYTRNKLNGGMPRKEKNLDKNKFSEMSEEKSACHQVYQENGIPNRKYIEDKGGHREVVYSGPYHNGQKTKHDEDMGTFNYFDPGKHPILHFRFDMMPYYFYGNSAKDNTTIIGRIYYSIQGL